MTQLVFRRLTDDGLVGDGTNAAANVNGSVTPVPFYAGPATGKVWELERMVVEVRDSLPFNVENYGNVATLSNGITLQVKRGGVGGTEVLDLVDGSPIKSGVGWASHCYDYEYKDHGTGDNFFVVRWTFSKAGIPLKLDGFHNDVLVATINDDLTALVDHEFNIQGIQYNQGDQG